ncbi:hypothetical protein [Xanthovirga aplysinae]|uniref:hypothetical protein n=1 Tax=Xanthovirga aplysinae TaxID=2529853 RepID=UPI0012BC08CE|nr:hypothetical protein [Xanthovirga aplysinae]
MKVAKDVTQRKVEYLGKENIPTRITSLQARYLLPGILEGLNRIDFTFLDFRMKLKSED